MHSSFYGIISIGSMMIALLIYNLAMFGWYAYNRLLHPPATRAGAAEKKSFGSVRLSPALVSTFKYRKNGVLENVNAEEEGCVVCLSGFEDDEDVRQLPRCNLTIASM